MKGYLILLSLMISSCAFKLWENKAPSNHREIASSLTFQQLLSEEAQTFTEQIDEKLYSLHSYQVLAQKNLLQFDDEIEFKEIPELYQSESYLRLMAVRTQIDEIETEITGITRALQEQKNRPHLQKLEVLKERIILFGETSSIQALSMMNLKEKLELSRNSEMKIKAKEVKLEYEKQLKNKDFQVFEKNIEHISHLLELKIKSARKKIFPSINESGAITGHEFPPKVWALTFDDGPHKVYSSEVLKNLKKHDLKATFFQLSQELLENTKTGKEIKKSGMEIASHSYSHKPLTLVGEMSLQKEIIGSTQDIEKSLKVDVTFFRLPYGIGVRTPNIRQKLADSQLIHVLYNVDSLDWVAQSPDKIIGRARALMKKTPRDSGILLFHDTHERSVIASEAIMRFLKENGRRTCTLGQIVTQMNEGVETVCPKF